MVPAITTGAPQARGTPVAGRQLPDTPGAGGTARRAADGRAPRSHDLHRSERACVRGFCAPVRRGSGTRVRAGSSPRRCPRNTALTGDDPAPAHTSGILAGAQARTGPSVPSAGRRGCPQSGSGAQGHRPGQRSARPRAQPRHATRRAGTQPMTMAAAFSRASRIRCIRQRVLRARDGSDRGAPRRAPHSIAADHRAAARRAPDASPSAPTPPPAVPARTRPSGGAAR